jgi:hypothetical protein
VIGPAIRFRLGRTPLRAQGRLLKYVPLREDGYVESDAALTLWAGCFVLPAEDRAGQGERAGFAGPAVRPATGGGREGACPSR